MESTIRLTEPIGNGQRSLRFFAGRSLGENEFDLMQTYVAERCNTLLLGANPGIVWGLRVVHEGDDADALIKVHSGLALGGDGRAIRVLAPIAADWTAVLEEFKTRTRAPDAPDTPLNGWFYLTVKRGVMIVDEKTDAKAATRTDLDILRDSRVETLATLDLQPVSISPGLLALPARRAINRLLAAGLDKPPFDQTTGAVPLALLKITDDALAIEDGAPVIDPTAGRFLAIENAQHVAFITSWSSEVRRLDREATRRIQRLAVLRPGALVRRPFGSPVAASPIADRLREQVFGFRRVIPSLFDRSLQFDPAKNLAEQLGVDFLPAAGPFPKDLVLKIAGRPLGTAWTQPDLRFDPEDLQIELAPIRDSQVDEMIARERTRGVVDLVNVQGDRLRLLVAVPDQYFSADLMNLPETDRLLNDAVHERAAAAAHVLAGLGRALWRHLRRA